MKKIAFVVLHYKMMKLTQECIASIHTLDENGEAAIVVVDNGSPDGSGQLLKEIYKDDADVTVLLGGRNLGFANGNNLGYRYARENLGAECIVVTNNDVLFQQKKFLQILKMNIERKTGAVIGPDIVTPEGTHQNPFRVCPYTPSEIKKTIFNKRVFLIYFYLKKWLHLGEKIYILEKLFERKSKNRRESIDWEKEQRGVVLQGACMIFMPEYVGAEKDAFCRKTFMYGEEDILADYCKKREYDMVYLPQLSVMHLDGKSTDSFFKKPVDKQIFVYKNTLNSLKVLKEQMKGIEKD